MLSLAWTFFWGESTNFAALDPFLAHLRIGTLCGYSLMVIYCYIMLTLAAGEEHPLIFRIITPLVIFIGGTIGFGFFRLFDVKTIGANVNF